MPLESFLFSKEDIKVNAKKKSEQSPDSQEIQIARLAFIGASIATLGDGIAAIAAGLALEALEKKSNPDPQKTGSTLPHSKDMQKQLDYLINELEQIKKSIK